ncbi:MAG TPA: DUF3306 domain-containing protein [Stellaceae bacterium]|nr:DUF3306 domain-containing protein [Stellaceae bacterium]
MAEEKFLARWSRRKRAAARHAPSAPAPGAETARDASTEVAKPAEGPAASTAPSLPPVDAIDGGTDIREFLAEGVPTTLARAALRRAWASDPAVRDFVGLAENAWDFNAPDQIAGFGMVSAEDVRRLLAHAEQPGSASAETPFRAASAGGASPKEGANDERAPQSEPLKDANQSALAHSEPIEAAPSPPSLPRHGGALPK